MQFAPRGSGAGGGGGPSTLLHATYIWPFSKFAAVLRKDLEAEERSETQSWLALPQAQVTVVNCRIIFKQFLLEISALVG